MYLSVCLSAGLERRHPDLSPNFVSVAKLLNYYVLTVLYDYHSAPAHAEHGKNLTSYPLSPSLPPSLYRTPLPATISPTTTLIPLLTQQLLTQTTLTAPAVLEKWAWPKEMECVEWVWPTTATLQVRNVNKALFSTPHQFGCTCNNKGYMYQMPKIVVDEFF